MSLQSCICEKCIQACMHCPGWMSPEEAEAAMDAGFAAKLMIDYLIPEEEHEDYIYVLSPAIEGFEGGTSPLREDFTLVFGAPSWGKCVFLEKGKNCALHGTNMKPLQCRLSLPCVPHFSFPNNYEVAGLWDTKKGHHVLDKWDEILYRAKGRKIRHDHSS